MAQYFQVIDQGEKTKEEIQNIYPNVIDNRQQTVRYVLNPDDQTIQPNQSIIVASEQFMLLDNGITFQNQQFDLQQGQQQIFYMESEENAQSVVLNHQPANMPVTTEATQINPPAQKVIMLQQAPQSQQTMVIQQPQVIQRQLPIQVPVQKTIQQRIQSPHVLLNSPRTVVQSSAQNTPTTNPRSILTQGANRLNLVKNNSPRTFQRLSSPIVTIQGADSSTRPNITRPPMLNRGGGNPRPSRGGVIQTSVPRPVVNILQGTPRVPTPRSHVTQRKPPNPVPNITVPDAESGKSNSVVFTLGDGRVVSLEEYNQITDERVKESKSMKAQIHKSHNRRVVVRNRPAAAPPVQPHTPVLVVTAPVLPPPRAQPAVVTGIVSTQPNNTPGMSRPPRIIQAPNQDNARLPAILRNFIPPPEIKDIISKTQHTPEFLNSIRMFVLLANGEQRLITFTMPKEDCTIQEILEQVGVPLQPDTKISISETNLDGINLVVTVGITDDNENDALESEESSSCQPQQDSDTVPELSAPEPEAPRYHPGRAAVCTHCGFLSDDFNKCIRCKSKLPDGIKSVLTLGNLAKKADVMKKPTIALHLKNNGNAKGPKKRPEKKRVVEQEPVILTLSSDEGGDEDDEFSNPTVEQLIKKAESQMHESVLKEPTINDIKQNAIGTGKEEPEIADVTTSMYCRTVRIGSYRFTPFENVLINTKEIVMKVPCPKDQDIIKTICVKRKYIVKVLVNFQKMLPVVFYYVAPTMAEIVRKELEMEEGSEPYFDPLAEEDAFKRITLLPDSISEESKFIFKTIYGKCDILEELNSKEANNILIRTCPKEISKSLSTRSGNGPSGHARNSDVRQLLIYPPGKGGLPINTEDYLCLAQDQFLNDVNIDFYLKYLVLNLPSEKQEKVHVFSTFFYKRLTTKPTKPTRKSHPTELDPNLTAAQKRHCRVKNWTKNVNIFNKDFIVVPINENAHWFLAIICFPGMNGAHTLDGSPHKLVKVERIKKPVTTIGNVTITQLEVKKLATVACDEEEVSDKDEAEGDESELDSSEETEETTEAAPEAPAAPVIPPTPTSTRPPIKQPCILIFDSLAGASRARVIATLRDYLSCEYKVKTGEVKVFNKDVIKGACPKVPQQTNYTDCGLYLLQYVESFFTCPIKDYHIPINELKTWFEEIVVTRKREEIADLIKELMLHYKRDLTLVPNIILPTLNGEPVELAPEEEEESMLEYEDDSEKDISGLNTSVESGDTFYNVSNDVTDNSSMQNSFVEEPMDSSMVVKPDIKEISIPSDKDTMSYLKAKRIIKTKSGECPQLKKFKMTPPE